MEHSGRMGEHDTAAINRTDVGSIPEEDQLTHIKNFLTFIFQ